MYFQQLQSNSQNERGGCRASTVPSAKAGFIPQIAFENSFFFPLTVPPSHLIALNGQECCIGCARGIRGISMAEKRGVRHWHGQ